MSKKPTSSLDLRGDLQAEVMATVWRLGEAKVEDVRAAQPPRGRSAYTTIQTVMNRLADRGLLVRKLHGNAYVYTPRYDEGDHLARTIGDRLAEASPDARRAALVHLVGRLDAGEVEEVARHAAEISRARRERDR